MPSNSPVYATLATIAYPIFRMKLEPLIGAEHLPEHGPYILAANHIDWLDGFYISAAVDQARHIPVNFLSASNNYWWTTITVQIPTQKSDIIPHVVQELHKGKVICNFPEGRRNNEPHLLPGKTGTVRMAAEAGVPIIPVGIQASYGKNMGESISNLLSTNHRVTISFGQPIMLDIPPGGISNEQLQGETERLMHTIAPLCHKQP